MTTQEIDSKTRSRNSLSPLGHFTEHLVGVFEKLLRENKLDHKSSRLSTRSLETQPAITCKQISHKWERQSSLSLLSTTWCAHT
jgi:hypothetical protein